MKKGKHHSHTAGIKSEASHADDLHSKALSIVATIKRKSDEYEEKFVNHELRARNEVLDGYRGPSAGLKRGRNSGKVSDFFISTFTFTDLVLVRR